MPNRLQTNWERMKPRILTHWDRLTETDIENVNGAFDDLVELIRKRYKPDRSSITVEAKIRDWLYGEIRTIERETQ